MNGFKLHKDGAVTTKKKKIPTVNKWVCTICGKEGYGLPHHECFTFEDKILSRLSSLEERVSMIEDPMGMKYWYNEPHTVSVIQPKEEKRCACGCTITIPHSHLVNGFQCPCEKGKKGVL